MESPGTRTACTGAFLSLSDRSDTGNCRQVKSDTVDDLIPNKAGNLLARVTRRRGKECCIFRGFDLPGETVIKIVEGNVSNFMGNFSEKWYTEIKRGRFYGEEDHNSDTGIGSDVWVCTDWLQRKYREQ